MTMEWKKLLSPYRIGSAKPGIISPERSPFQRDCDRIVFSSAFRRLQDKTQVFPLMKADFVRTRLTHSMETSSIARSLGTAAGAFICKNFDCGNAQPSDIGAVVASAALAHDIGNPPLGHPGEEAIRHWFLSSQIAKAMKNGMTDKEIADIEKYEGNAQGFRILTKLQMPDQYGGMQLTCATLGAFVKYPTASLTNKLPFGVAGKKFNFFQSEVNLFREVAEHTGLLAVGEESWCRHPLAFLVEAADDIAYRIVDFEDGQRLGLVDYNVLEKLFLKIIDDKESYEYCNSIKLTVRKVEFLRAKVIGKLVQSAVKVFIDKQDELLAGKLENSLITYLPWQDELKEIAQISRERIYGSQGVTEIVAAGFEMVSGMLDIFVPAVNEMAIAHCGGKSASFKSKRLFQLIPDFLSYPDLNWASNNHLRLLRVLDYVSGMTDTYAVSLYQKLKGISI